MGFNKYIYKISVVFSFIKHAFLLGLLLKQAGFRKIIFWHLFGILDLSENTYTISLDFSFIKHVFLLALLLKHCGIRKAVFWTSIWGSGFQQIHTHVFGRSRCYKACFSIGASAETGRLQENCILNIYFGILGLSENTSKCSVHFSFINHVSLVGLLLKHAGIRKPLFWTSIWDSGFQQVLSTDTLSVVEDLMPLDILSSEPKHFMVFG